MRGLAERGAGNFYFVEDATAATEVFTEELDFFMSPLALDIKIEANAALGLARSSEVVGSRLWPAQPKTGSMRDPRGVPREPHQPAGPRRAGAAVAA